MGALSGLSREQVRSKLADDTRIFLENGGIIEQVPYDDRAEKAARVGRGLPMGSYIEIEQADGFSLLDTMPDHLTGFNNHWGEFVQVECEMDDSGVPLTAAERDAAEASREYYQDTGDYLDSDEYL